MIENPWIRPAGPEDVKTITDLARSTFTDAFGAQNDPEHMQQYLDENMTAARFTAELQEDQSWFFLVGMDQEAVGYGRTLIKAVPESVSDPNAMYLERFYLDQAYHGKGIARIMMAYCAEQAREQRRSSLWLTVWEYNPRAIAFYKKYGFETVGSIPFQFGPEVQNDKLMVLSVN